MFFNTSAIRNDLGKLVILGDFIKAILGTLIKYKLQKLNPRRILYCLFYITREYKLALLATGRVLTPRDCNFRVDSRETEE